MTQKLDTEEVHENIWSVLELPEEDIIQIEPNPYYHAIYLEAKNEAIVQQILQKTMTFTFQRQIYLK